ncbi:hypothetical protein DFA_10737 [Cavenderia fasciculata]|uniref:Uncharacterized protein n=1 Tax=Cavenderia fasciculata TaxID=261658 RepID=F4QB92_CACFS|nr:uncharacterized protein DFA_10737 [Cavenderia fasciculata]EGG14864.1 hypothetical protein DFA_10737 [Cavenderia fasciculata]|eukprot:XP_004351380.1 hypothetical protein DFA_10737 [Cavenderia fasciculata]
MSSLSHINFDIDSLQEYDHSTGGVKYQKDRVNQLLEREGVMMGGGGDTGGFNDPNRIVDDTPMFQLEQVQYNPKGVHSMTIRVGQPIRD